MFYSVELLLPFCAVLCCLLSVCTTANIDKYACGREI